MEVVTIEKKTFEAMLTEIATLVRKVDMLCEKCNDKKLPQWLDNEDVCRRLRISPRTLQTLRDTHMIGCTQINRKFFYKPEEVARLLPLLKDETKT